MNSLSLKPVANGQKILVENADGTIGQVTVDNTGALKVAATVTANVAAGTPVTIQDATMSSQKLAVDSSGKIGVNSLPAVTLGTDSVGLAKESGGNLAAIKTDVDKIPSKGSAAMAGSLPVTLATDDTIMAAVKADVDKIPSKGTAAMSGSTPVTIATDDTLMAAVKADADKIPSKGTAVMTGSTPVTIATDDTLMAAIKAQLPSPALLNTPAAYTTTASYTTAVSGPLAITKPYKKITINVKENNTNAILYQIIGYTEATGFTRPITLVTNLPVSKNGSDYQVIDMPLLAIDVQAVDAIGGTHGSVNVDIVLG